MQERMNENFFVYMIRLQRTYYYYRSDFSLERLSAVLKHARYTSYSIYTLEFLKFMFKKSEPYKNNNNFALAHR